MFTHPVPSIVVTTTLSATTIAVSAGRDAVTIVLGGHKDFTVSLLAEDVVELMTAVAGGEISYVACTHPVHGRLLLNARPTGDILLPAVQGRDTIGPCELSLTVPGQRTCRALFDSEQALNLLQGLNTAWELIDPTQPRG